MAGLLFAALAYFTIGKAAIVRSNAQGAADAAALAAAREGRDSLLPGIDLATLSPEDWEQVLLGNQVRPFRRSLRCGAGLRRHERRDDGDVQPASGTAPWRGNELNSSGVSVAGVTLVDKVGKKRYYVLRDTDGRCLCTTGLNIIEAGQTMPFFAQFPAPPTSTVEVDLSLPTFATATVKLSG
ncbi:pilus assembly protein TadG-related protein [Streptomyces avidinii]